MNFVGGGEKQQQRGAPGYRLPQHEKLKSKFERLKKKFESLERCWVPGYRLPQDILGV
jgi:hypothetical protein